MTKRSQARGRRSSRRPPARRAGRWLLLPLGLGAAALAGWVLLSTGAIGSRRDASDAREPAHADIGEASREQLVEILRNAEREDDETGARQDGPAGKDTR